MAKIAFFKKILSMCYLSTGGAVVYGGLSIYNNNEIFYRDVFMPLMMKMDPELSHNIAVGVLKRNLLPKNKAIDNPILKTKFLDKEINNPIGIAAGFDKNGEAIIGLKHLGFGCIEIGSVTPNPQPGNPKPRVFRLTKDSAIINRYGFNSDGHSAVLNRLNQIPTEQLEQNIFGVNLGKNKDSQDSILDYTTGVETFGPKADYLVINISSPNTPGLRNLQMKDNLYNLLCAVIAKRNSLKCEKAPFILLKLAPDLSADEKSDIIKILNKKECKVDGLIISNTTVNRANLSDKTLAEESGGLSGKPLKDVSTEFIREMYKQTKGKIPIIGVGGVASGKDAFEKIIAGATIVQFYTAFIYHGPPIVSRIKSDLSELLSIHGFSNVNDAVGKENIMKKK